MITFKLLQTSEIEIAVKMMQEFYAIDNYPFKIEITKKLFEEFINNENFGKSYLIYNNKEIIGYTIMTFIFSFEYKGRLAFFEELFINKSARGLGIGKLAIDFIKTEAEKLDVKMMYLEVENHNEFAQKLYLSSDFIIHNRMIMKYKFE